MARRAAYAEGAECRPLGPVRRDGDRYVAPVANVALSSVAPQHEGKASGATNAIRELGGVFGVAVLASVFAHAGGYRTANTFTLGTSTAVWIGGGLVALGAVAAALIRQPARAVQAVEEEPAFAEAA